MNLIKYLFSKNIGIILLVSAVIISFFPIFLVFEIDIFVSGNFWQAFISNHSSFGDLFLLNFLFLSIPSYLLAVVLNLAYLKLRKSD